MADRKDYFFKQLVTESELDQGFDGLENADREIVKEVGLTGVTAATVTQNSPTPDISVNVQDLFSFDKDGQRVVAQGLNNVDMLLDFAAVPTLVAGASNEKILTLFVQFDRALSDPRLDGNNDTVFFVRDESFTFIVKQGAESLPPATPVPAEADKLIIADVTLIFNQTQILNADIDISRRESLINTDTDIAIGDTLKGAITDLADFTDALIAMGINEKYRRQSTKPAGATLDTPGDGATFIRDGKAITGVAPNTVNWASGNRVPDPFLAGYRVEFDDYTATTALHPFGGDAGLVIIDSHRETSDVNELTARNSFAGARLSFIARDVRTATLSGNTTLTHVPKGASAVLNTGGLDQNSVKLNPPNYFRTGGQTALRIGGGSDVSLNSIGADRLFITFNDGTEQTYVIDSILADDEVGVTLLGSQDTSNEPAFTANEPVTVQWLSLSSTAGNVRAGGAFFQPARLDDVGSFSQHLGAVYVGNKSQQGSLDPAVVFCEIDEATGRAKQRLAIAFNGTIQSFKGAADVNTGRLVHAIGHRSGFNVSQAGAISANIDPENLPGVNSATGEGLSMFVASATGAADVAQTITFVLTGALNDGAELKFVITNNAERDVTMVWPSGFTFETPGDAQMLALNSHPAGGTVVWSGLYANNKIYMTKREYWN